MATPEPLDVQLVVSQLASSEREQWNQLVSGLEESQLYSTDDDLGKVLLGHAETVATIHEYFSDLDPGICRTRLTMNGVIKSTMSSLRVVHDEDNTSSCDGAMVKEKHSTPHDLYNVLALNQDDSQLYQDALLCASFPRLCVIDPPMTSPSVTSPSTEATPIAKSPHPRTPRCTTPRSVRSYSYDISGEEDSLHVLPDTQVLDILDEEEDEEMMAIPPETLCDHLRKCFHLSDEAACHYQSVVYKINTRRSQAKLLAEELSTQLGWLEANMHPFYNPKKFVSRYAYDQWQQWKRGHVTQLLSRFWSSPLPCPKSGNPESEHSKHQHYRMLLNALFRYDNLHRSKSLGATTRVCLLSSASKRLLKEYGLRFGVDDFYRKIVLLDLLASNFDVCPPFVRHVCDVIEDLMELLPPNRGRIVMVQVELDQLIDVAERLRKLCADRLSKIKQLFPKNDPPSAVENLIDLLRLSVVLSVYLTGNERPSISHYLLTYCKASFIASYERYMMLAQHDMRLSKMNEEAVSPQLLNTLMKNIIDEVQDYKTNYQQTFEKYIDIAQQAATTFYALLMADVRHCCETLICVPRDDHSLNLSLLSIVFNLSQFDQTLAQYIPMQCRSWHGSCIPHVLLWLNSIKLSTQRLVIKTIDGDQFCPVRLPVRLIQKETRPQTPCTMRRLSNGVPLKHSRNSPFTLTASQAVSEVRSDQDSADLIYPTSSGYVTGSNCDRLPEMTSQSFNPSQPLTLYSLRRIRSDPEFGSMLLFSGSPHAQSLPASPGNIQINQKRTRIELHRRASTTSNHLYSKTELQNPASDVPITIVRHAEVDYDVISVSDTDEVSLGISSSFLDVYVIVQRYVHLARCLLNAAIPLPEFGEKETGENLMPDLSRYIRDSLSDRKRVYLKILKGLCNVFCLYCDNVAALDLCALPKAKANDILSRETLRHLGGLYSSNLVWGCRHTKAGLPCDFYHNRSSCTVADKYEPVTQEMCNRVNSLVAIIDVIPSLREWTVTSLQGERLQEMISQKLTLDCSESSNDGEFEWISSYNVSDDSPRPSGNETDDVSADDPFDLQGKLDEPFKKCSDHAERLLDNLLDVMSYRFNLFIKASLGILLTVPLPHTTIENRLRPLTQFLKLTMDQLKRWLYPKPYTRLMSKMWGEIVKDFEEEIADLLKTKSSTTRSAEMYMRAITYLVRVMNDKGKGMSVDELMDKMERLIFVLKLFMEPAEGLISLYYHLDRQSNDSDLGSLLEEPLSKEYLHKMRTELHMYKKCFSARELHQWILRHPEPLGAMVTNSTRSLSVTDDDLALEICHRLVEDHVICDVRQIHDLGDAESSDFPVTYPKIAICTDFMQTMQGASSSRATTASENSKSAKSDTPDGEAVKTKHQHDVRGSDEPKTVIFTEMTPASPVGIREDVAPEEGENEGCEGRPLLKTEVSLDKTTGGKIVAVHNGADDATVEVHNQEQGVNDHGESEGNHESLLHIEKKNEVFRHETVIEPDCDKRVKKTSVSSRSSSRSSKHSNGSKKSSSSSSRLRASSAASSNPDAIVTYDDHFNDCDGEGPIARSSTAEPPDLAKFTHTPDSDDSGLAPIKASDWTYSSSDEELRVESDYKPPVLSKPKPVRLEPDADLVVSNPSLFRLKSQTPPPFDASPTVFYCFTNTIDNFSIRKKSTTIKSIIDKLQKRSSVDSIKSNLDQCVDLRIPASLILCIMNHRRNKDYLLKSYIKRLPKHVLKVALETGVKDGFRD